MFRYSALTFNGHRIHYDRRYVTEVEGYPGLVVHGPLIATLLADLARRNDARPPTGFNFRASRPLFDTARFAVRGSPAPTAPRRNCGPQDELGALAMEVEIQFAADGAD